MPTLITVIYRQSVLMTFNLNYDKASRLFRAIIKDLKVKTEAAHVFDVFIVAKLMIVLPIKYCQRTDI